MTFQSYILCVFCTVLMNLRMICIRRKVSSKWSHGRPRTTKKWYPQHFKFLIAIISLNLLTWALFYILCFTHQRWQVEKQAYVAVTGREPELFTRGKFFSLGIIVKWRKLKIWTTAQSKGYKPKIFHPYFFMWLKDICIQ